MFRSLIAYNLFLICSFHSFAQQKSNSSESMIWVETIEKLKFDDRLSSTLLWHHRVFLERVETYQDIYWVSLDWKATPNLSFSGGFMYFTYRRNSSGVFVTVPERRPFQSVTFSKKIGRLATSFRFMLEERYMGKVAEGEVLDGHNFNLRFRNRIKVLIPIKKRIKLEFSEEYILNGQQLDVERFSQNRTIGRIHYAIPSIRFGMNVGYLHWLVNTSGGMQHRHTLMMGIKHRLDF